MTNSPDQSSAGSCELRWARPIGNTFDEMRANVWKTGLADIGDTIMIWVNEGDLWQSLLNGVELKEYKSSDGEPSNGKQPLMASRPAPPVPSDHTSNDAQPSPTATVETDAAVTKCPRCDGWGYAPPVETYSCPCGVGEEPCPGADGKPACAVSRCSADSGSELLPCPFCGSAPVTNRRSDGMCGQIYCKSDDCFGPRTTAIRYQDSVVQWNARTLNEPQAASMTEAMGEIVNRAGNFMDPDAGEWMPSIYKIACEAVGVDPWPMLEANGWKRDQLTVSLSRPLPGRSK